MRRDELSAYAAALTYSLLFALFPLALALAGTAELLHVTAAQQALVAALAAVVSPEVVHLVAHPRAAALPAGTLTAAGAVGYLYGMSSAFLRMMDGFNHAYECPLPQRRGPWRRGLLALLLAFTLGGGLVAALLAATFGQYLVVALVPVAARPAARLSGAAILLLFALGMLAVLYWVVPDCRQPFRLVTPGALAALGVWLLISYGFSIYLSHFNSYALLYGSVGAVILLLLYLYFLSYALLLGAEINALLVRPRRSPALPPGPGPSR